MASLNKILLIGHLGKDPETRYMPNGEPVANFSLATKETWKDKNGQKQEKTEWHQIVMYRRLAEIAGQYLKKGSATYLEGRLQTRKWQDKEGKDRYTTEIIVDQMQMLDSRSNASNSADFSVNNREIDKADRALPERNESSVGPTTASDSPPYGDQFDDDIPF